MSLLKTATQATVRAISSPEFVLAIGSFAYTGFSYATNVLLGRLLGPQPFGILMTVIGLVAVFNFVSASGPAHIVPVLLGEEGHGNYEKVRKRVLSSQLLLVFGLLVLGTLVLGILWFGPLRSDWFGLWFLGLSTMVPFAGLNVFMGLLAGQHRHSSRAMGNALAAVLRFGATWGLVGFLATGPTGGMLAYAIAATVAMGYCWWREGLNRSHADRTPFRFPGEAAVLLKRSLPPMLSVLFLFVLTSIDILAVEGLSTHEVAGRYAAVSTLAKIPFFLAAALQIASVQAGVSSRAMNPLLAARKVRENLAFLSLLLGPGIILVWMFPSPLLLLFYGPEFSQPPEIFIAAVAGMSSLALELLLVSVCIGAGLGRGALVGSASTLLVGAGAWVILFPKFGPMAIGLGTTVGSVVGAAVLSVTLGARLGSAKFLPGLEALGPPAFGIAAYWGALALTATHSTAGVIACATAFVAGFALLIPRFAASRT